MALFGLFGKKDEPKKGDFFLDFEEAQTFGDADYMKEVKTIKRTFPKLKGNPGKTIVSRVSSDDMSTVGDKAPAAPAAPAPSTSSFAQSTSFASAASFTPANTTPVAPAPAAETLTPAAPAPVAETPAPEAAAPVAETPAPEAAPAPTFTPAPVPEKKPDNSMDMFRNMAKNIRR